MKINNLMTEKSLLKGDLVVWMIFLTLCMVSLVEVYSASSTITYKDGHYWQPIMQHGAFMLVGIFIAWFVHRIPYNYFKVAGTVLMHILAYPLLVWALFASRINDAARWVDLGFVKIQPSEIAKICLVTFVTFVLAQFRNKKGEVSDAAFKVVAFEVMATIALIVTENASTAGIIFLVMLMICFYAQVRKKILAWIGGGILGLGILGLVTVHSIPEHTLNEMSKSEISILHRLPTWINRITQKNELPADPKDYNITENVQVTHAQIAIGTSNIIGKGPGNSVQRDYLPQAYSDFIYAIIIEETGIVGAIGMLFLYLLLMWRSMKIASRCKALFPAYLVMGLALMMVVQAMVNMAVAVGAFPVTGQPLPLVSRGGSSMFVNCTYIGMILSVSYTAKKKEEFAGIEEATQTA